MPLIRWGNRAVTAITPHAGNRTVLIPPKKGSSTPPDCNTATVTGTNSEGSADGPIRFCYVDAPDPPDPPDPPTPGAFPRLALIWQGNLDAFRDYSRSVHLCCNAEYMVMNQFSSLNNDYRTRINAAIAVNPDFKAIRYVNPLENNDNTPTELAALQLLDNPNRGGSDNANDGLMRQADGTLVGSGFGGSPPTGNTGTNVSDWITPYQGTPASSDSDRTRPKTNERGIDYAIRAEYFRNIDGIDDYTYGGFFDVSNRYDINKSPGRPDYDNSGSNRELPPAEWQAAVARQCYSMFGNNLEGNTDTAPTLSGGAPAGRPDGSPWYEKDNTPLVSLNGIDWEGETSGSNGITSIWNWLDTQVEPTLATPLIDIGHGNLVEFALGGGPTEGWFGGIDENGVTLTGGGSFPNCVDLALGAAVLRDRYCKVYPVTGRTMISVECRARNYWAASHFFLMMCMTDHLANMRDDSGFATGGFSFIPFGLDEHVGEDWVSLTEAEIAARKGWMGDALTSAFPNNVKTDGTTITADGSAWSVDNSGLVWVREFENALVLGIPGRSYRKNKDNGVGDAGATPTGSYDLSDTATVNMSLFPPGAGFKWQRISGTQQPAWNNGADVGATITLGTASQNVNQNSIILKRVPI